MRSDAKPPRVVLVDDHPISRCAYRALLRSEGVNVLADVALRDATLPTLRRLAPDLVIVDVSPGLVEGFLVARRAESLQRDVILTSSAPSSSFGSALSGFAFIAKADICRAALAELLRADRNAAVS